MLKGVSHVEPGYMGGSKSNPTYEQVSGGDTGHVEVIKIDFDPDVLAYEEILHIFFTSHDPTTLNRQGNDVGTQYRSVVFYTTDRQKEKAEHYIKVIGNAYTQPIVTTVELAGTFWPAEDYHKKYYEAHKDAPYCELIIAPKVDKIATKFPHLLKGE
ncbi:MAG: methionine sulfoxide reductase peptide-methionine (S)-S-oxide reductase [Candidatus Adlerbacteria bacterium]|nr:methionine sulfoxide reductase peptide-methionine (S)-S-oxide reductase [Candidatus Adlerbacteria bacterium]